MTVSETAHALGISRQRVQQLIYTGKLPARRHGASWYIELADVTNELDRRADIASQAYADAHESTDRCVW